MTSARSAVPWVSTTDDGGSWQPTPLQALLLDAAFGNRARAERAFDDWAAVTGFDDVDTGSFRLLPLVGHHLEQLGVTNSWSAHLRGILRRSWYENQVMQHATLPAVDALLAAGVDVVVFKGGSLSILAYDNPGVRPMQDLDVLVPEARAADALGVLLAAGWEPDESRLPDPSASLPPQFLRFRHSVPLRGPAGFEVDLHWHATYVSCWPGADAALWETTRPLTLQGRCVRALAPEDELIVTCVHGLGWNQVAPIRWIADALTLMHRAPIDWDAVTARASAQRVEPLLALTFELLRTRFDAPVPVAVVTSLRDRRPGYFERHWLDSVIAAHGRRHLAARYGEYLRSAQGDSGLRRWVGGLPQHLVYLFDCHSATELPAETWRRVTSRVRDRLVRRGAT
jgi:hypothetical protein